MAKKTLQSIKETVPGWTGSSYCPAQPGTAKLKTKIASGIPCMAHLTASGFDADFPVLVLTEDHLPIRPQAKG
jgi:hypothetical protein